MIEKYEKQKTNIYWIIPMQTTPHTKIFLNDYDNIIVTLYIYGLMNEKGEREE